MIPSPTINSVQVEIFDYESRYGNPNLMSKDEYIANEIACMRHYGINDDHIDMRKNILESYVTDKVEYCSEDEMDILIAAKAKYEKRLTKELSPSDKLTAEHLLANVIESLEIIEKITILFNYVRDNMETCSLNYMSSEKKTPCFQHAVTSCAEMKNKHGSAQLFFGQVYWSLRQFAISKWSPREYNYTIQTPAKAEYKLISKDITFLMGNKFFCIDIDVDINHAQTKVLLNSFPSDFSNKTSFVEKTSKGLHYYFKKTDELLALGAIDGARSLAINSEDNKYGFLYSNASDGSVTNKIDYIDIKSQCRTLTRGLCKCWPSPGRILMHDLPLNEMVINKPSEELNNFLCMAISTSRMRKVAVKISKTLSAVEKSEFDDNRLAIVNNETVEIKDITNDDSKIIAYLTEFTKYAKNNYAYDDWLKIIFAMVNIAEKYYTKRDLIYELIHEISKKDTSYKYEETQAKIDDAVKQCEHVGIQVGRSTINEYFKQANEKLFIQKYERSYEWVKRREEMHLMAITGPQTDSYLMIGLKDNIYEKYITYIDKATLKNKYDNVFCYIPNLKKKSDDDDDYIKTKFIKLWFEDEYRRSVRGVCFCVNPDEIPKNYISSFRCLAVENIAQTIRDYSKELAMIFNHIKMVFCSGNIELYNWFMQWMASILQRTGIACGCVLTLQDKMGGNGKSLFCNFLSNIIGSEYAITSSVEKFFGKFNSSAYQKLLCIVDEGASNDSEVSISKYIETIKSFTTSDYLVVEMKGKEPIRELNHANVVILTNNTNIFNKSGISDFSRIDRREVYMIIDENYLDNYCDEIGSNRKDYFTKLAAIFDNKDIQRAFYDHIKTIELWSTTTKNKMALLNNRPVNDKTKVALSLQRTNYEVSLCNFINSWYASAKKPKVTPSSPEIITNTVRQHSVWIDGIISAGMCQPNTTDTWVMQKMDDFLRDWANNVGIEQSSAMKIKKEPHINFFKNKLPMFTITVSNRSNVLYLYFLESTIKKYLSKPENSIRLAIYDEDSIQNDNNDIKTIIPITIGSNNITQDDNDALIDAFKDSDIYYNKYNIEKIINKSDAINVLKYGDIEHDDETDLIVVTLLQGIVSRKRGKLYQLALDSIDKNVSDRIQALMSA